MPNTIKNEQWRTRRGSCDQMRPRSTGLGQMGGFIPRNKRANNFSIGPPHPQSSMKEVIILLYEGLWATMG